MDSTKLQALLPSLISKSDAFLKKASGVLGKVESNAKLKDFVATHYPKVLEVEQELHHVVDFLSVAEETMGPEILDVLAWFGQIQTPAA